MIIDTHVYLGSSLAGYALTEEELLNSMDQHKIDRCFILPVMPMNYNLKEQNDYIAGVVEAYPDRFYGFCRVDPRQKQGAVDELVRCITDLKLKGLLLNPWEENFQVNDEMVYPLMAVAQEYGIPVMIEAGYPWVSHATQIADLCKDFIDVPVIMTHGGQLNISGLAQADAMLALESCSNILINTAGVYRQDFLEEVVEIYGGDRIVFGSHSPVFSQGFELKRIETLKINKEEIEKILFNNALRIMS